MSNFLKDLNLDRLKIKDQIVIYCQEEYKTFDVGDVRHINNTQYRCEFVGDNKKIMVDFYFKGNGTTTIKPVGQNLSDALKAALFIKTNLCHTDIKGSSYSIPNVENETVDLLIEYLLELEGVNKINEDVVESYTLYRLKGMDGDKVVIKHFSNKRLQVQGKPLYLYQEITYFLAEFSPFEDIVNAHSEFYNVSVTKEEIQDEFDSLLPTAKGFIGDRLKRVLSPALAYRQIDITLPDYSGFVFPVLRALEGYIKLLFKTKGILIAKRNGFDEYIFCHDHKFFLRDDKRQIINCEATCLAIEKSLNYFNEHRNGLFHADGIDENIRLVETKQEANRIISLTFKIIEETYRTLPLKSAVS